MHSRTSGLTHGLHVLSAIADGRKSFSNIQNLLGGLAAPTLSRVLKTLVLEAWVEKAEDGSYRTGSSFVESALQITGTPSYVDRLQELVERLARESGQTAAYVEWEGAGFIFRAKAEMPDSYHHLEIGQVNGCPTANGFGHVFYAWMSKEEREKLEIEYPLPNRQALLQNVETVRSNQVLKHQDIGIRYVVPVLSDSQLYAQSIQINSYSDGISGKKYLAGVLGISLLPQAITAERSQKLKQLISSAREEAEALIENFTR